MADETPVPTDPITDSIRQALQAAAAATDAADECAVISTQTRKVIADATSGQRRMTAVAGGALVGAIVCAGLSGLVYLRSMADLREAAELQAAANKVAIEQIQSMQTKLAAADATVQALTQLEGEIGARFDGLGDRIKSDLAEFAADAAVMQPQMAAAIQTHVDTGLKQTRGEILTALAELEMGQGGAGDPDLKALLADLRDRLASSARAPTPRAEAGARPAPKPKAKSGAKPASAPPAAKAPFSYP